MIQRARTALRDNLVSGISVMQDWFYHIATHVPIDSRHAQYRALKDDLGYEPIRYAAIRIVFRELGGLGSDDVFYEVGCGMGRMVCLAARYPVRKSVGIEYMPHLAALASTNARALRGRRALIEIRAEDAAVTDYTDATVIFFYNPFGAERLRVCLDRIRDSLRRRPRRLRIVFVGSEAAPRHVLETSPWLRTVKKFKVPFYIRARQPAILLEAKEAAQ